MAWKRPEVDGYPPRWTRCFIWHPTWNEPDIASYGGPLQGSHYWDIGGDGYFAESVTHYMVIELPQPPETN
jgi:hypothetical protein